MAEPVNKRRLFTIVLIGLVAIAGVSFWSGPAIELPAFDFPKLDIPGLEAAKDWLAEIWPDNPIFPAKTAAPPNAPKPVAAPAPAPTPGPVALPAPVSPASASQTPPPPGVVKQPGAATSPATTKQPVAASKPVMPIGANVAGQTMRDVFAPPQEYVAAANAAANSPDASGAIGKAGQAGVPTLTGVIQGGGSRVVILRFGAISRSYREGDAAGAFKVDSIGAYSVTLSGPNGNVVLSMGQ